MKKKNNKRQIDRQKGVLKMSSVALKIKPIKSTPEVSGKYAKEVICEALRKPSESSTIRNQNASILLKKLKG